MFQSHTHIRIRDVFPFSNTYKTVTFQFQKNLGKKLLYKSLFADDYYNSKDGK